MLYNDLITYNQTNITYNGTIKINVPGISDPIILGGITVFVSTEPDYSNATTVGLVTYDFAPTGILTLETTEDQAFAISQASAIYLVPSSETSTAEIYSYSEGSTGSNVITSASGEVTIESV